MNCAECPRALDRHAARGLCQSCYRKHHGAGTHIDFERRTHPRDEVLAAWTLLRPHGQSRREVATKLGMTLPAFERACTRARAGQP